MITITINPQTAEQVQILATAMISLLQAPEYASRTPQTAEQVQNMATAMISLLQAPEVATVTAQAVLPPEQPAKKAKAVKPAPAPAPAEASAPAITLEEVRAKLVAYKEKGNSLKDLFETVGCANLSAVPADRYAALLANMEEM